MNEAAPLNLPQADRPAPRRPRRAAYALPTLFTSGNIFLGFLAIIQAFQGALQAHGGDLGPNDHFANAAKAIGFAVFFDGLDGWIARMTHTVSDFGRELDSLSDVIAFGIAPAVLAFVWGVQSVQPPLPGPFLNHVLKFGYFVSFFYLLCGAARLARFNIQTNPVLKNPGRPDRKYFAGMPIPAGAGFVAAIVFFDDSSPLQNVYLSAIWLGLLAGIGLLMVSTWRYPSFKQINISKPRSPLVVLVFGVLIYLIWNWAQVVLLVLALGYVSTGIFIRIGGIVRRRLRRTPPASRAEHQIS
ncbi:MAG: CDP-diacylglycerol--serine O-phosphatidyltransferase [Bryobacteraceae bacterium]